MYLDSASGQLHIRLVYAGAPLSGKTETLRSLLPSLSGRPASELLVSPSEARGRTLYFDWGQWKGGLFRSGQLNCQITAVPGQDSLQLRRRTLVEDADAVVFVIDSQRDQMAANRRSYDEIRPWLERDGVPPVPVILQCNKRDLPDPVALDEIRRGLGLDPGTELYECSATQGEGIRICFVASVGACVRRAEALIGLKKMPEGRPPVAGPEELLERLRLVEKGAGIEDLIIAPPPEAPAAEAAARPAAVPAPAPVAARTGRPPVMPMADWLAGQQGAAAAASPAAPAQTEAAPAARARAARPAVMPMAEWLASPAALGATAPSPPGSAATSRPPLGPSGDGGRAPAARVAPPAVEPHPRPSAVALSEMLPVPWMQGREAMLLEAWPAGAWRDTFSVADPTATPPTRSGTVLYSMLGAGRLARASRLHASPEGARTEYQGMMQWLTVLDGAASNPRCLALSGTPAAGFCAWQLLQRFPTLDLLVVRAFDKGLSAKDSAQYLAYAANSFVLAAAEFSRREPRLPIQLRTLARQDRRTVYADFLPEKEEPAPAEPVLGRLEDELRTLVTPERRGGLNVPEVLRELEALAASKPNVTEIVELLQSLLIGE